MPIGAPFISLLAVSMAKRAHSKFIHSPTTRFRSRLAWNKAGLEPKVMPYAEYAVEQELRGAVSVELRRVALTRGALRDSVSAVEHPLREWLVRQYG